MLLITLKIYVINEGFTALAVNTNQTKK